MKIRIINEKSFEPLQMDLPEGNPAFAGLREAPGAGLPDPSAPLGIYMHEDVYRAIMAHAGSDLKHELGGMLLGLYCTDGQTGFLLVTDVLNQPPEYHLNMTEIRFTTRFYEDVERYLDAVSGLKPNLLRLGQYHTHPNYGVFLSQTDKNTYAGIFKLPFQIAMVVDPANKASGVFCRYANGKISDALGYWLYSSEDGRYKPGELRQESPQAAAGQPDLAKPATNRETGGGDGPPAVAPAVKIVVEPPEYIPRTSILYDINYASTEWRLHSFFRLNLEYDEYPYQIFVNGQIQEKIEELLVSDEIEEVGAIIKGNYHFDKLKNTYFVDWFDIMEPEVNFGTEPHEFMRQLVENAQSSGRHGRLFGWVYASEKVNATVYPYFDFHRRLFGKAHHLGMVIPATPQGRLRWNNAFPVAYDFENNKPFNYFHHLFLYRQRT